MQNLVLAFSAVRRTISRENYLVLVEDASRGTVSNCVNPQKPNSYTMTQVPQFTPHLAQIANAQVQRP